MAGWLVGYSVGWSVGWKKGWIKPSANRKNGFGHYPAPGALVWGSTWAIGKTASWRGGRMDGRLRAFVAFLDVRIYLRLDEFTNP